MDHAVHIAYMNIRSLMKGLALHKGRYADKIKKKKKIVF